jgi:hypothetical protein
MFAFHWQTMHAEEMRVRERSEVRVQTLAETAGIALRGAMLRKDAVDVMILVEGLVRENHDVLSARVGGKDGKAIAETEAEHIDEADARSARVLTLPIVIKDGSGSSKAIGTIDLRISTKEVEQVASGNMTVLMVEGCLCLFLCGGLIVLTKKHAAEPSTSSAKSVVKSSTAVPVVKTSTVKAPSAKSAAPAPATKKREMPKPEPRGPQPSKADVTDDEPVEVSLNSPPPVEKS